MRGLIVYALAVCARRYGVLVHAYCTMSTHLHLVITDVDGTLPLFLAQLHRVIALATKVLRKWEGAVWDHEQTSVVRLETPEAVVDAVAYVLANPVAAGLVRYAADWTGAHSRVGELGRGTQRATRPTAWFDPQSACWPDDAELALVPPQEVPLAEVDRWRRGVGDALVEHEHAARADVHGRGWRFRGMDRVEETSPYERAKSVEPLRGRNPSFAVGGVAGAYVLAVRALRAFREAYRAAMRAWRDGVRDVLFPAGTWWMRHGHGARVEVG